MGITLTNIRPIAVSSQICLIRLASPVQAGYPTSVEELPEEGRLDLNTHLACNPMATFVLRVSGDSMEEAGIPDGCEIIVDRSREARVGDVVVASIDEEYTLKRLARMGNRWCLRPENPEYPPIWISEFSEARIWGVVIKVLSDPC